MPLSWDETKTLMRLKGVVEDLLQRLPDPRSNSPARAASKQLEAVVDELKHLLETSAPQLALELRRIVDAGGSSFRSVEARGAAIVGWLRGAVDAEVLQRKIESEAEANAQARERTERPVGFQPPKE